LLIFSKKEKYVPLITKLKAEIIKICEDSPQYLITVIGSYDFNYYEVIGEELVKNSINNLKIKKTWNLDPFFYKWLVFSIVSKDTEKIWMAYIKSNLGSTQNKMKVKKLMENFFFVEKFNIYQIQFFFNLINLLLIQKEIHNFSKILKGIFYNHTFMEEIIKNEMLQLRLFKMLNEIQRGTDPFLFFQTYFIFLKLESSGLTSFHLYVYLKNSLEHCVMHFSSEKFRIFNEIIIFNIYFLIKNGFYPKKALSLKPQLLGLIL